jgi:hypothetical protein
LELVGLIEHEIAAPSGKNEEIETIVKAAIIQ